jgi:hypothetical protein
MSLPTFAALAMFFALVNVTRHVRRPAVVSG